MSAKTPGLVMLVNFAARAEAYVHGEDVDDWNDLVDITPDQGMVLLGMEWMAKIVRAARDDHRGGCAAETCGGTNLDPCDLSNALQSFAVWERKLR